MRGAFEDFAEADLPAAMADETAREEYSRLTESREAAHAMHDYQRFLEQKSQIGGDHGFEPTFMPDYLFDFQRHLVEWAVRKGRAALFTDCGTGKAVMQLVWAQNVAERTGKPVLILTPLAVGPQLVAEGEKFGVECHRSRDGTVYSGVTVTNYQQLAKFNPGDFGGIVCDESSILKNFTGATRGEITDFMSSVEFRLLCTATAAPNDYTELGTSSEALGAMKYSHMLSKFFTHDGGETSKWRLKGHARKDAFWRWICTWARAMRMPSDLGFSDGDFTLPALIENEHTVAPASLPEGMLFDLPAVGLDEQRAERKRTIVERCEKVADLVDHGDQALVWCDLNAEGDMLTDMIPDAEQVRGADSDDRKEDRLSAFQRGDLRVLVTKPKIGAWGLNLQGCAHVTFFPTHSYEQYYQGVRRCWRFGQHREVVVDVVSTPGSKNVMTSLKGKSSQADAMFKSLIRHMRDVITSAPSTATPVPVEVPSWLS